MKKIDLLRIPEVSELTGVPVATLRGWRQNGTQGPPSRRIGRRVVYRRADVERWVDEQFASTPKPAA